ncbi:bifunctional DNA primase/polymerase, partial [Kineosporia sp. A_224]|uniref:bifunctional DNA primase/polymerase n=1 Tax=Kineosporia sp. A_224 TaxID=1962180 RepID=UPI000B4BDC47
MSTPDPTSDPYDEAVRVALAHAGRGWHVFPLVPGHKRPAVTRWQERATLDPARIERCWSSRTAAGPYGVGIATGPSRLVVVDLDTPKPNTVLPDPWRTPGVVDGADVLAALADRAGHPDPAALGTYSVLTPSGGTHLYFAAPGQAPLLDEPAARPLGNTAGVLGPLVDTRAAGGYVVAPPTRLDPGTRHGSDDRGESRARYIVEDQASPVLPLPGWLVARLRPDPLPAAASVVVRLAAPLSAGPDDRAARYVRAALDRTLSAVLEAAPGTRNRTLFGAAVSLGRLVAGEALDEAETRAALITAGTAIGLDQREATATVRSGLRTGAHHPRTIPT